MRTNHVLLFLLPVALFAFVACGDDDDTDPTPTTAATSARAPEATPTNTSGPSGSGVKLVDEVIAAVTAKDVAKLTSLLRFWPRPCTEPQGIGALPCPTGSPIGTPVNVIHSGGCEGSFFKPGDPAIATALQNFVGFATKPYAVVKSAPFFGDSSVPGTYQIVFEPGKAISVDGQGITSIAHGCGNIGAAEFITSGRFGPNPEYLVKP